MKLSLRSHILLPFIVLIITTSVAIIGSVLFATHNNINNQAEEELHTGKRIFERLMSARGDQLITSSEILVSDFGFKTAIASEDKNTILSALENYQQRISVDLMMIHNLDGALVSTTNKNHPYKLTKDITDKIKEDGGILTALLIKDSAYQVAILPVMAPTTIAWATVGVAIDDKFANELKTLTNLDISFSGNAKDRKDNLESFHISTLSTNASKKQNQPNDTMMHVTTPQDEEFLSLPIPITENNEFLIQAYVFSSLTSAYAQYNPLKWQIFVITLLALIFSIIGALFISKNISQPIAFFVKAARRISDGHYNEQTAQCVQNSQEISELEESFRKMQTGIAERESKILHQAYYDTLTSLPNRTQTKDYINTLIKTENGTEFSVISINIIGFSQINDTFGFDVGDSFLKTFAERLDESSGKNNISARLSADDFITVMTSACLDTIAKDTKHLKEALEESINISGIDIAVSIRLGVSLYPEHGADAEQLLRRSGIALNVAESRNISLDFYEPGEEKEHLKRIRLISDLGDAIKNNDLVMYYQPKVDLHTQTITQVEALIRWIHKDLGFIPPDDFIGLAESSGMMPDLTRWVLTSVAAQAKIWRQQEIDVIIAVNLSAHDIAHDGLPSFITQLLSEHQLKAKDLMLEITESAVMENPNQAIQVLEQFKSLGIDLSIDDFGTGYSSLSQLKSMPVDELKIDKSFILNLENNKDDQVIVQSTIQLGHNIGLRIVAEGVETQAAWHLLEQWGCDKLQGYFISRPVPADDFSSWFPHYEVSEFCRNQIAMNVDFTRKTESLGK